MVEIYARDLKEDLQTDVFMGEGFEKLLKESEAQGKDLIIGSFSDSSDWRVE